MLELKILKDAKAIGVDTSFNRRHRRHGSNALQSVLAQAVAELGGEVVYCGKSAADTGAGSTGPGVAERMGWASVSNIVGASFSDGVNVVMPSGVATLRSASPSSGRVVRQRGFQGPKAQREGHHASQESKRRRSFYRGSSVNRLHR